MFQYAQCILRSLTHLRQNGVLDVVVAYGDQRWSSIVDPLGLPSVQLRHLQLGRFMAKAMMAFFTPPWLARTLSGLCNPLIRELNRTECDLWLFPAQDEITWQVRGPVVSTIHDLMHRYERRFPEAGSWWRYLAREYRFRNLSRRSEVVLVDSELGKHHVIESYSPRPQCVQPLPYIAPSYIEKGVEREGFTDFYSLPEKFYFYPAQFWPHKNHIRLVRALVRARSACPDMALVLAGSQRLDYKIVLKEVVQAGLKEAVRFVGYVPDEDMAAFYKRAHGLVMPTFFGPTNIPPLEAMASGCPVLISSNYAMREQCGDAALLFNPESEEEMSTQMVRLWTDNGLWQRLSVAGLIRTQKWGQAPFQHRLGNILTAILYGKPKKP
jgi:glycosyltransferase involved in cell wall biosynthesis